MSGPIRVLVCGGRHYSDRARVNAVLNEQHTTRGVACVIEGGATGADRLARDWAKERGVETETYPADWSRFGAIAGPMRNNRMLVEGQPDLVVAFPGGKGTADMVRKARGAGVPVLNCADTATTESPR